MKNVLSSIVLVACGAALAPNAIAGAFTTNSPSGQAGSNVNYTVSFAGDGSTLNAQLIARLDGGSLTRITTAAGAVSNGAQCLYNAGTNTITVNSRDGGSTPLPAAVELYCTYTIAIAPATAVGAVPVTVVSSECSDLLGAGDCLPAPSTLPVNVVLVSPEFNINPAIANPLAFSGTVGSNIDRTITVENIGDPATSLTLAGTVTGAPFSIVSGLPNAGIAQGANANIVVRCNSAAAGTFNDTLVLTTNDPDDGEGTVNIPLQCVTNVGPTAPTASLGAVVQPGAGPINTVSNGTVPVNVLTGGTAVASLGLNCTIPTTGASNFLVTAGGTRTITAPATVGANAPAVGVSCVLGAAPVNATLSCAQTATPGPSPAALTAVVTCPAGVVAPSFGSSPAPGGTIAAIGIEGTTAASSLSITNTLGTAPLNVTSCTASAGFTITSPAAFPVAVAPGGSTSIALSCVAPAAGTSVPGTLTCAHNATNVASPATYVLACNGVTAVVPTMSNLGKILLASLVIGLGLLGMGLRRQA